MLARRWLCVALLVAGCGDDGTKTPDANVGSLSPAPSIDAIRPTTASFGGEAFTMQVDGTFRDGAIVLFDGNPLATSSASAATLSAMVTDRELSRAGAHAITVLDGGDRPRESNALAFHVVEGKAQPSIDTLNPATAPAGSPSFQLTVRGWNFYDSSVVLWNGVARPTVYISSDELQATIAATDVATAATVNISVATDAAHSTAAPFTIEVAQTASVERVSLGTSGTETTADADSVSITDNGRFVAFSSDDNTLVAGDTANRDVFIRDTCFGATSCSPSTSRVSVAFDGSETNGGSRDPMITGDGRYVVFSSDATNLIANDPDTTHYDVFVRDTCRGVASCTPSTVEASVGVPGGYQALFPVISSSGRFVAFTDNGAAVYWRDTCIGATGCTPRTQRIDAMNDGTPGNFDAESSIAISGNGRYVAFISRATNLDGNATNAHAYVTDTCAGASGCTRSVRRLDVAMDGTSEATGFVTSVSISSTGRYATFTQLSDKLVTNNLHGAYQVFLRDTCAGASGCTPSTLLVTATSANEGGNASTQTANISATGRFVMFDSYASDFVAGDTNNHVDVFVRDLCIGATGCTPSTHRLSIAPQSVQANGDSFAGRITPDGRRTVWTSDATNLVTNDTNGKRDAFVSNGAVP